MERKEEYHMAKFTTCNFSINFKEYDNHASYQQIKFCRIMFLKSKILPHFTSKKEYMLHTRTLNTKKKKR